MLFLGLGLSVALPGIFSTNIITYNFNPNPHSNNNSNPNVQKHFRENEMTSFFGQASSPDTLMPFRLDLHLAYTFTGVKLNNN